MPNYIRPKINGATVFFTVALADRSSDLLVREIGPLRAAIAATKTRQPFQIRAWVILPDHMHCIWTLPDNDHDYSTRMAAIKARFSHNFGAGNQRQSHINRREKGIWQRRFWEHHIRSEKGLQEAITYCWHNPVKHGYVAEPKDWPYSTWHRDNKSGTP